MLPSYRRRVIGGRTCQLAWTWPRLCSYCGLSTPTTFTNCMETVFAVFLQYCIPPVEVFRPECLSSGILSSRDRLDLAMSFTELGKEGYPPEIIGYAEPWIVSPGDSVAIKVSTIAQLNVLWAWDLMPRSVRDVRLVFSPCSVSLHIRQYGYAKSSVGILYRSGIYISDRPIDPGDRPRPCPRQMRRRSVASSSRPPEGEGPNRPAWVVWVCQ